MEIRKLWPLWKSVNYGRDKFYDTGPGRMSLSAYSGKPLHPSQMFVVKERLTYNSFLSNASVS
jgi:hypothetical protein